MLHSYQNWEQTTCQCCVSETVSDVWLGDDLLGMHLSQWDANVYINGRCLFFFFDELFAINIKENEWYKIKPKMNWFICQRLCHNDWFSDMHLLAFFGGTIFVNVNIGHDDWPNVTFLAINQLGNHWPMHRCILRTCGTRESLCTRHARNTCCPCTWCAIHWWSVDPYVSV